MIDKAVMNPDTIEVEEEETIPQGAVDTGQGSDDGSYRSSHYLLFGGDESFVGEGSLNPDAARAYLGERGFNDGQLSQTRRKGRVASLYEGYHAKGERVCDFCGRALTGVEFERLRDGRDRCMLCSRTVVRDAKSIRSLYMQTREGVCERYDITIDVDIEVRVVSAKKLSKATGQTFTPTPGFDARAVGLAVRHRGGYRVLLENGTPRLSLIATTAHELTHIWQYTHWDAAAISARYGKLELAVYEGMAKWCELQYLYLLNETTQADRSFANEVRRDDVYGFGLRCFLKQYPLSRGISLEGETPFMHPELPLDPAMMG